MKRLFLFIFFVFILFGSCFSQNGNVNLRKLFSFDYDRPKNPDTEKLSIIRYILKNTYENNIHKMRGEIENTVYVNEDGREAVFDKDGNIVTNSYNGFF